MNHYSDPVSRLLNLNEPSFRDWPNYPDQFGFSASHIPELIEMLTDEDLHTADSKSAEIWAPVHAWRSLGQLKADQAIPSLLSIIENFRYDDCVCEEIPAVIGMIGETAIEAVRTLLNTPHDDIFINLSAADCLLQIATRNPDSIAGCVQVLVDSLQRYQSNDSELNGCIISNLVDLEAALGHIELIKTAFDAHCVDETILGDFEDLQVMLGLLEKRITPGRNYLFEKYPHMEEIAKTLFSHDSVFHEEIDTKHKIENEKLNYIDLGAKKPKIGRNDPCPCGSGKKYKKCCLLSDAG